MPQDKIKRAISVALSLSMMISAPQIGSANLVPINGILAPSSTPPPPCQTMIAPSDAAVGLSMKSFEAKFLKRLSLQKIMNIEKIKPKTLATDESGVCSPDGSVTYTFKADTGVLTISGAGDKMQDYLPSQTGGAPWYSYQSSVKNVVIEDGITSIGNYAFANCDKLISITIPSSLTSIRAGAFSGCRQLASITIPDDVTSIGEKAFSGCYNLKTVTIPEKVISIGNNVFEYCSGLTAINIPETVTSLGNGIFKDCNGLKSITVAPNNNNYKGVEGVLFSEDGLTLIAYPAGKTDTSYNIPAGVTSIGDFAFKRCNNLKEIQIPESVTLIGNSAFHACFRLESINIPNGVTEIGSDAFNYCSALTEVTIPEKVKLIGNSAFRYCNGLISVVIPQNVVSIGNYALAYCEKLNSITILGKDTTIGDSAFAGCKALESINLGPDSDYKYENGALFSKDGTSLIKYIGENSKTYTIPNSVVSIGDNAFSGCNKLTEIIAPESVTSIGSYAFAGCNELVSINIPNSVTEIGRNAFFQCSSLTSITIPDKITSIESSAFYRCSGLTSITIPDSVTSIANSAFGECTGLVSVKIGTGVKLIKSFAFDTCTHLTSIAIPDGVTSIEDNAFNSCSSLTVFEVSENNSNYSSFDGVLYSKDFTSILQAPLAISGDITLHPCLTSIGPFVFSSCSDLTSLTIPASVTSIERFAFYDCSGLTLVTYTGTTEPTYGSNVFDGCNRLTEVKVPLEYTGETFCGLPVNKMADIDSSNEGGDTLTGGEPPYTTGETDVPIVDPTNGDGGDSPMNPGEIPNKGSSKTGVIAGSVVAAVAIVAAVVVTAVMYVKKLACFGRAAASVSEGGAPAEEV